MRGLVGGLVLILGCTQPAVEVDSGTPDAGQLDAMVDSGSPRCPIPVADQLDPDAMEAHLVALAAIAADHGGERAVGEPGYAASVDYVVERIRALGLEPSLQHFTQTRFAQQSAPEFVLTSAAGDEALTPPAYQVSFRSGAGRAEGPPVPIGHDLPACGGCALDAWTDFPLGGIAWVRGEMHDLAELAFLANLRGASALLLEVAEDSPERVWNPRGPVSPDLPILLVGRSTAERLALADRVVVSVDLDPYHEVESENVILDLPGSEPGVVMIGAHLDSVLGGPGINDNGTGVAATLELMAALDTCDLQHGVRFAFWGSEEWGLLGSKHWVESTDALDEVQAYLNLDMVGSPNGGIYLLGDHEPGTLGARLAAQFDARGVAWRWDETLVGRSDHAFFRMAGIPVAGVFSGAEGIVNGDEAAAFGSEAGMPNDACYHRSCDTLANVDRGRMQTAAAGLGALAQELAAP